eukprot:6597605-Pyramimonas_sp.AAC.1
MGGASSSATGGGTQSALVCLTIRASSLAASARVFAFSSGDSSYSSITRSMSASPLATSCESYGGWLMTFACEREALVVPASPQVPPQHK